MKFGSVCSGIEAASCAWESLGWKAAFFSEIEKFPSQVLAHHYPDVPNMGDMTKFKEWPDANINVLVGGTPCQSFSVAGLRRGLDDPRGNLMLTFLAIADRYRPKWLVWENVPGVLSSNGGKDFGTFLGGLGELGYGFAYRVLDAQYFGVPQRRRRVFVVACLGNWQSAAAVLFERHCFEGHPAPSRKKGEDIAGTFTARANSGGWGSDVDLAASNYMQPVAKCLTASKGQRNDSETENFVGFWNGNDIAESLTCTSNNQRMPDKGKMQMVVQPIAYNITFCDANGTRADRPDGGLYVSETDVTSTLTKAGIGTNVAQPIAFDAYNQTTSDTVAALRCAAGGVFDNAVAQPISFSGQMSSPQTDVDMTRTLGAKNPMAVCLGGQHPNAGIGIDQSPTLTNAMGAGGGHIPITNAMQVRPMAAMAWSMNLVSPGRKVREDHGVGALTQQCHRPTQGNEAVVIQQTMAVRRLTPVECERLQGFPDGYTDIKLRGKETPDGPRYKALGNSMAVPVMRWIGERIQLLEDCL